jgi:hypothetical protein
MNSNSVALKRPLGNFRPYECTRPGRHSSSILPLESGGDSFDASPASETGLIKPLGQAKDDGSIKDGIKSSNKALYWMTGVCMVVAILGTVLDYYLTQNAIKNGVSQGLAQAQQNRMGY